MHRRIAVALAMAAVVASTSVVSSVGAAAGGTSRTTAPPASIDARPVTRGPSPVGRVDASTGQVTVGANQSDPLPKAAFAAMMAYCATQTGVTPKVRTYDHTTFQAAITTYLRGKPADVFTWFGGELMRSLVRQHLVKPISDVWAGVTDEYSAAMKAASTASDGKQYLVPTSTYPWVFLYRKSLFAAKGYTVPTTFDELIALAMRMQADGLVPMASADLDGWPAMGTFDILDMRLNGYRFHMDLMAGKAKWTDPRVKAVFVLWKKLLPYTQPDALGRTWQQGAQALIDEKAGMYFFGTFAADQATDPAVFNDLGLFAFPTLGTAYDAEMAIDAPVDGLMLSRSPKNLAGARSILACAATGPAQLEYVAAEPTTVAANVNADTSGYWDYQKQMDAVLAASKRIAQFFDRDTRPDFAGPTGMQRYLRSFLANPNQDLSALQRRIRAFYEALPPR
jgi:multiple sugar transport system substrate-binding protein